MAATIVARLILFLSSYSPLFVIVGLLTSGPNLDVGIAFYLLAFLSGAGLVLFLKAVQRYTPHEILVAKTSTKDSELTGYVVTYLLPFLAFSTSNWTLLVSLGVLFAVIAILYVQSGMIHINPLLSILGYHLFDVETQEGKVSALISRRIYVRTGSALKVVSLSDYILMEKIK